jgi:hypothetical protein
MRCQWLVPGHSPYLFCFLRNGHNPYLHLAVKSLEFLSMLATGNCIGIPHNSKILVFLSLWRIKYHLYGEAYLYFLMSNNSIVFSLLDKRSVISYIWELELYAGKAQIFLYCGTCYWTFARGSPESCAISISMNGMWLVRFEILMLQYSYTKIVAYICWNLSDTDTTWAHSASAVLK